jgi:hypothetical protein
MFRSYDHHQDEKYITRTTLELLNYWTQQKKVSLSPNLKTETDPVSEALCFQVISISGLVKVHKPRDSEPLFEVGHILVTAQVSTDFAVLRAFDLR